MGAVRSIPMNAGPFDENNAMPLDCPTCGKRLTTNGWRTELEWEGHAHPVFMFLCLILLALLTSAEQGLSEDSDASSASAVTPSLHPYPRRA
jgi:hypothetical protein